MWAKSWDNVGEFRCLRRAFTRSLEDNPTLVKLHVHRCDASQATCTCTCLEGTGGNVLGTKTKSWWPLRCQVICFLFHYVWLLDMEHHMQSTF